MIGRWTPAQWVLRLTMVAGILVALTSTGLAGTWPRSWLVLVVGLLGVGYAVFPEVSLGTVAMGIVLGWWGVAFRDGLHWPALVAAAALVVSHVAGVLVSYGPERMRVDGPTVRLWARRSFAVFLLSPVVLVAALWVREEPEPPGLWLAGTVVALIATAVAAVIFATARPSD